jgi:hypothetical protein
VTDPKTDQYYVYAILDARVRPPRIRGHRLEIVSVADFFTAVERLTEAPEMSETSLRDQHQIVVRLGRAARAILPVRFGAFVGALELARVLRLRRRVLRRALRDVRGMVQMTVRVFGTAERRGGVRDAASGTDYLRARAESARVVLPSVALAIREAVRDLVVSERVTAGRGAVQVTVNHLVPRGRAARYRSAVARAIAGTSSPAVVVTSGPWPPFAFTPDFWSAS